MTETSKIRLAVIGLGNIGKSHVNEITSMVPETELAAVCDILPERADQFAADHQVPAFYDYQTLLARRHDLALDGVVVATPHYDHTPISIDALGLGLHVMVEKPLAVHVKDGRKMVAAYERARKQKPDIQFGIMFQQRTHGYWQKIKELIDTGQLGKLVRATWLITDWFRPQCYYDNGGWRATWKGEGGGVLLNQCPHNLDLYQWFFGVPKRVAGFAQIGKYHNIEVEDEVTGYFEHENGMVGHFVTTTAESPGTNRLEVVGEMGKLVFEGGKLTFSKNKVSMFEYIRTSTEMFGRVESQQDDVPFVQPADWGHADVLKAFAAGVLRGEKLVAEAPEGINSLALGNAIMLSTFQGRAVELPLDEDAYEAELLERIKTSRFEKTVREAKVDMQKSFH